MKVKEVRTFLTELEKSDAEFDKKAFTTLSNYFKSSRETARLNYINILMLCIFLNKRFSDDINECRKNAADGINKECLEFSEKLIDSYKRIPLYNLLPKTNNYSSFPAIEYQCSYRIRYSTAFLLYDFASKVLVQPTPSKSALNNHLNSLCKSILRLDSIEFGNLMKQQLRTDTTVYFCEWINEAVLYPQEIPLIMSGFLQLIIDYKPLLIMSRHIESSYNLEHKRIYSDNHSDNPDENEAGQASLNRRIKQLFMAMLYGSLGFGNFPSDDPITIVVWDKTYIIPEKIHPLYLEIASTIHKNRRKNLKFTFTELERVSQFLPAYSLATSFKYIFFPEGHNQIVSWLEQFHSGVFYDLKRNPWFDECVLLHGIFAYAKNHGLVAQLTSLMDMFCHTVCNDAHKVSDHYIELRLNILFREYLNRLSAKNQNKLLNFLINKSEQPVKNRESWLEQFFLWRLPKLTPYSPRMKSHQPHSKFLSGSSVENIKNLWENGKYCANDRISLLKGALKKSGELTPERSKYLDQLNLLIPFINEKNFHPKLDSDKAAPFTPPLACL